MDTAKTEPVDNIINETTTTTISSTLKTGSPNRKKAKSDESSEEKKQKKKELKSVPRVTGFKGEVSTKLGFKGFALLCTTVAVIVYYLANDEKMLSGPFMLDAGAKIEENPEIRQLGVHLMNVRKGSTHTSDMLNYNDPSRPLQTLTFQLNYKYGFNHETKELEANVFRITNFVMHAFNAILVGWFTHLLRCGVMLHANMSEKGHTIVAVAAAAIFAASPFTHFSAMYTYARSDIMGATGTLLFTIFGMKKLLKHDYDYQRRFICFEFKMLVALLFGLFSKQLVVIAPAALLLIHLIIFELPRQSRINSEHVGIFSCIAHVLTSVCVTIYCHLPSFLVIAAYFIFRLAKFGSVADLEMIRPDSIEYFCYIRNQPYAWFRYGITMFYPEGLAIDHHLLQEDFCQTDMTKYCCIALFALFVVMVLRTFNIAKAVKRQSPIELLVLAGLGWFGLNILPSSASVTTDVYCERRAYTSAAGIYAAFSIILGEVVQRVSTYLNHGSKQPQKKNHTSKDIMFASVVMPLLAYFMLKSVNTNPVFYSDENLWRNVIAQYPDAVRGRTNLANAISAISQKQIEGCINLGYEKLVQSACPGYNATTHKESLDLFKDLLTTRPTDGYALIGIARYNYLVGNTEAAIEYYERAASATKGLAANAYLMIGTINHKEGKLQDAILAYKQAINAAPELSGELYNNLALAYLHTNKLKLAKKTYQEGMKRFPNDKLLLSNREVIESPRQRPQQENIPPEYSGALYEAGLKHHQKGELDKALVFFKKIMEINPTPQPEVFDAIAIVHKSQGRDAEAQAIWKKGIAMYPGNDTLEKNQAYIFS